MTTDDMTLLREYARGNSEEAFAALVSRHVNLVYSVALLDVRDPHLAEEITQAVFIILARKAGSLGPKVILSGWLCRTARFVSANALTIQRRRQQREQEAYMQSVLDESESDTWAQIAPLLGGAMKQLGQKDQDALVLRFFENKSFQEIGSAFGASENAAKKRVAYALEKLRKYFSKCGVRSTTAAIAGAISTNSVHAAPGTLAKTAAAVAFAKGATASGTTLTLIQGALKVMAWAKVKMAILVGAGVLLAAGAGTVAIEAAHRPDIQGYWEGTFESGTQKERLVFKITKEDGVYHATGDYIEMGIKDAPFSKFVYQRPSVHFEGNNSNGEWNMFIYDATLNPDMSEMSGAWTQRGNTGPLLLRRTTRPAVVPDTLKEPEYTPRPGSVLQGFWAGTFKLGTNSWLLYLKIAGQPDGTYRAEADTIDASVKTLKLLTQGWKNVPATSITFAQPAVNLEFNGTGHRFEGEVSGDNSQMTGFWAWADVKVPVTMKRADPGSEDPRVGPVVGVGVALDLDKQTGALWIRSIVPNSPAAQAGVSAGTVIQKVDDVSIAGKSLEECAGLIRGLPGTKVRLELVMPDTHMTNILELRRQRIQP